MKKTSTTKKTLIVFTIAFCIAIMLCTITLNDDALYNNAYAADETADAVNDSLIFNVINNGTEYNVMAKNRLITEAIIPATYKGLPVTEIMDNGFISCTKLTRVYIPYTVKKIGNNAFANCAMLEEINGMSKVNTIGNNAFAMCKKLNDLILPPTISKLGSSILRSNPNTVYSRLSLEEMTAMNPSWKLNTDTTKYVYGNNIVLNEVYEAENLIGYAVKKEQSIFTEEDIVFGDTVISESGDELPLLEISRLAFMFSVFNSFTLKHGSMTIYDTPSELSSVVNEESSADCQHTVNIASNAFMAVTATELNFLVDITFDDISVDNSEYADFEKYHSVEVFAGSGIDRITLPDSLTLIPNSAFSGCWNLKEILSTNENVATNHLSSKITSIGREAFVGCTSLEDIFIPNINNMGQRVFAGWGGSEIQQTIHFEDIFYMPPVDKDGYNWDSEWTGALSENATMQFKPVNVIFDKVGGEGGSDSVTVSYGQNMPQATAPEKTGYTFGGYKIAIDGQNNIYYDKYMNGVTTWNIGEESVTLTAIWNHKKYFVNLINGEDVDVIVATYDKPMPAKDMPIKTGYELNGYFTEENGQGVKYFNSDMSSARNWDIDVNGDINLYAFWTPIDYTITFYDKGGSSVIDEITGIHYFDSFPAATKPQRAGCIFKGYYTLPDGEGDMYYTEDMKSTRTNYDIDKDLVLYADWENIVYTINYCLNGGVNNVRNPKSFTVEDRISLLSPSNHPLIFIGWKYLGKYISELNSAIINTLHPEERSISLYADWTDTRIYSFNAAFNQLSVIAPKVGINLTKAFSSNCTLYVGATTKYLEIFGNGNSYNINIVVDSESTDLSIVLRDINIRSHTNSPAIIAPYSAELNLYAHNSVRIEGSTKNTGFGTAAIECGTLNICEVGNLFITGGSGKNGQSNLGINTRGQNGGNAGPGIIAYQSIYVLCSNVTIEAGRAGDGGNGYYKGYGGKGSAAIVGNESAPNVYVKVDTNNVHFYKSEDGRDGTGIESTERPIIGSFKPGIIFPVPDEGIVIPKPPVLEPIIK